MARRAQGGVGSLVALTTVPWSPDLGLLLLRVWMGLTVLVLHGWPKLQRLLAGNLKFADPLGLGSAPSMVLATAAETLGALLVIVGLATRWSALAVAFTLIVAVLSVHGGALTGENNGELPFVFAGAMLAIVVAGPGRYSIDARWLPRDR
jgi:putative oxidoreductase